MTSRPFEDFMVLQVSHVYFRVPKTNTHEVLPWRDGRHGPSHAKEACWGNVRLDGSVSMSGKIDSFDSTPVSFRKLQVLIFANSTEPVSKCNILNNALYCQCAVLVAFRPSTWIGRFHGSTTQVMGGCRRGDHWRCWTKWNRDSASTLTRDSPSRTQLSGNLVRIVVMSLLGGAAPIQGLLGTNALWTTWLLFSMTTSLGVFFLAVWLAKIRLLAFFITLLYHFNIRIIYLVRDWTTHLKKVLVKLDRFPT